MNNKVQVISRRSHVPEERGGTLEEKIPPVYAFRTVKVHGNQGFFRMVGRQVDKVILFPQKQGSKCGKMDKKRSAGTKITFQFFVPAEFWHGH